MNIKTSTEAGVSRGSRQPLTSMEINDQINGHQGTILDDKAGSTAKILSQKVSAVAGIVGRKVSATQSKAYAN